jgi:CoA:oxalate CoA-transferase
MVSPVAQHYHVEGNWAERTGRTDGNAPSGFFLAADGRYVTVFASYPALWDRFVAALGLEHLNQDARFSTREKRTANASDLHKIIAEIFQTKDSDAWVELLLRAGVPVSPVNNVGRMIDDEQIVARKMIVQQEHPKAGKLRVVGIPVKLSDTPGEVRTPAPLLGEHTSEIITQLGHGDQIEALRRAAVI